MDGFMDQVTLYDDTIISFMKAHGAKRVGIFGSYARGEAYPITGGTNCRPANLFAGHFQSFPLLYVEKG